MAYVKKRRIFWALPAEADFGDVHVAKASDGNFLTTLTASPQLVTPFRRIPKAQPQELVLAVGDLPDDTYQFAVVAEDSVNGKFADPYQAPAWGSVFLDLSPLSPASAGGFELL